MKYITCLLTIIIFGILNIAGLSAQLYSIRGQVSSEGRGVEAATIHIKGLGQTTLSDSLGTFQFHNIPQGSITLLVSCLGYQRTEKVININAETTGKPIVIELTAVEKSLDDIVITGTMKEVSRTESPVPVEVFSPAYFKKNPTPNIFEALQNVNGVRPQINCNVCNTGDIHINGLEGPYTMVMIDGMPIVSALSTVYGLSGIPNAMIERVEIIKGPASSLYGSEAVGGVINIITKKTENAPAFSADIFGTTWQEYNADLGFKLNAGKKADVLTGINYFNYNNIVDNNRDGFTDVTLQNRFSVFQKWNFTRKNDRLFSIVGRYMNEDRWGGDVRWNKSFRGGDSIYGESIYTHRGELLGNYQLPFDEKMNFMFSLNSHAQDSRYGDLSYIAEQHIAFGQYTWNPSFEKQDFLLGIALRYTFYDDNTPATEIQTIEGVNTQASQIWLPGIFIQDEIKTSKNTILLLGFRYDYNSLHGNIYTPRIAYKWNINANNILRFNAGTGYRVVNLFTEDHAALTGARTVRILEDLKPESSYNSNLNYIRKIYFKSGAYLGLDASAFYTYFNNRIIGDFDQNPNEIIYENLQGYAVSKGLSLNLELNLPSRIKIIAGGTFMDVSLVNNRIRERPILTEYFTGIWAISYTFARIPLSLDYTGNIYSPMRLPLLSEEDPRKEFSPWWSLQNIQCTYTYSKRFEIYGGLKNLLNWTPNRGNPFIVARAHDPFDKQVVFDAHRQALPTPENPYGLTFDPTYVYGPNQGIRGFLGLRVRFW